MLENCNCFTNSRLALPHDRIFFLGGGGDERKEKICFKKLASHLFCFVKACNEAEMYHFGYECN